MLSKGAQQAAAAAKDLSSQAAQRAQEFGGEMVLFGYNTSWFYIFCFRDKMAPATYLRG